MEHVLIYTFICKIPEFKYSQSLFVPNKPSIADNTIYAFIIIKSITCNRKSFYMYNFFTSKCW